MIQWKKNSQPGGPTRWWCPPPGRGNGSIPGGATTDVGCDVVDVDHPADRLAEEQEGDHDDLDPLPDTAGAVDGDEDGEGTGHTPPRAPGRDAFRAATAVVA